MNTRFEVAIDIDFTANGEVEELRAVFSDSGTPIDNVCLAGENLADLLMLVSAKALTFMSKRLNKPVKPTPLGDGDFWTD